MQGIHQLLEKIYGDDQGRLAFNRLISVLDRFDTRVGQQSGRFSQSDVILITYGDSLRHKGQAPIKTLNTFASKQLKESISGIHFLPFFPYSSDDGFSVIDYLAIDPELGSWEDVAHCSTEFDLMFDYVLNHISAQSPWFHRYLAGEAGYADLAIEMDPSVDISMVTRPRALPLLTPFTKDSGEKAHLWTTFSDDQIDLNYQSLDVLTKMIEVLLFYVQKGARLLRMDAIAYLWKELGTSCIHLSQTHDMVRLFRKILDHVAPDTLIVTETNVPHAENISYFGNGIDEAQMVYNFTLPPLLLHAFVTGDVRRFSQWVQTLSLPSEQTTFFNFTASHDGIGVRPLEGILPSQEIQRLVQVAEQNGGQVSYKQNSDGSKSPYELNVTYVDALGGEGFGGSAQHAARFLASQAIQLALPGVPGVYIHSVLGSRNWQDGVQQTGRARTVNREKLDIGAVLKALEDPGSFRARIFFPYRHMLKMRRMQPAFHPNARCDVLPLDSRVFGIKRSVDEQTIYAVTNISADSVPIDLEPNGIPIQTHDLLSDETIKSQAFTLKPYQRLWLTS